MQELIAAVIVLAALVYAAWTFMPAQLRRRLAALLGLSERAARAGDCHGAAACDGCRAACGGAERKG